VDDSVWVWIWLVTAVVFAIAEMGTAGFFLLPFAVGAAFAFVLALLGAPVGLQWLVFIVLSVLSLWYLQRFVKKEDSGYAVGANRYSGKKAIVLEDVDRIHDKGMVRMETEEWRATTEGGIIAAGTLVKVVGVTGTRLVVEPDDEV
jgi:membrane protein implicated in regulation of membrane protease activity